MDLIEFKFFMDEPSTLWTLYNSHPSWMDRLLYGLEFTSFMDEPSYFMDLVEFSSVMDELSFVRTW